MRSDPPAASTTLRLVVCIFLWYSSSAVCNTSARKVLTRLPLPLWLCVVQFACAAALGHAYLEIARPQLRQRSPPEAQRTLHLLALVYTVGFVFVNAGYVVVNVSLAETLRSAEPIFSVLFAKLWLKEEFISSLTLLSLVPIVLGGAFSSGGDATFNVGGLFFVCMSNTAFALRSIVTKRLKQVYAGFVARASVHGSVHGANVRARRRDAINVFYEVSLIGLNWLVLGTLAIEVLIALLLSEAQQDAYSLFPHLLAMRGEDWRALIPLVLLNGLTYALYNQMSFLVLSFVSVVSHAVANSVRRVVTIVASVWYFRNPVSAQNAAGMTLAIAGVVLYSLSKSYDEARTKTVMSGSGRV